MLLVARCASYVDWPARILPWQRDDANELQIDPLGGTIDHLGYFP